LRRLLRFLGLAEYGGDEICLAALACGAVGYALALLLHPLAALAPLCVFAIVVWFFRDPHRAVKEVPGALLSPADGKVMDIEEVFEPEFIQGRALRIGIFLSPFNVHVNRVPCSGAVRLVKYKAGEFLPAYNPKAPERNEAISLGLETPDGLRVLVKQISGVLARRIICDAKPGEQLVCGQRYGMIKFGSRTELYVPTASGVSRLAAVGDKVKGGLSACCKVENKLEKP
jgi:phosphatidylserine decarboxylase